MLRGKHKPTSPPHIDTGDHVVVINADKVIMSRDKMRHQAGYRHSGYPGGISSESTASSSSRKPADAVRHTIKGMLPKGPLGRPQITKLKVYAGPDHPHAAQSPKPLDDQPLTETGNRSPMATKPLTQTTGRRKEAVARARLRRAPVRSRSTGVRSSLLPDRRPADGRLRAAARGRGRRDVRHRRVDPRRRRDRAGRRAAHGDRPLAARSSTPTSATMLKKAGLLTRDPRKKESKKYGLVKARKAKQFTKR